MLAANPLISEFMASNRDTLLDGSSPPESSDWIELYNAGDTDASLAGWYLTDDAEELTKWKFPRVDLPPNGYLVVFASGNATLDAGGHLHTNFRLRAAGEFLALVEPDGSTIVSQFGTRNTDYPRQIADVSYGLVMQAIDQKPVVAGAAARALIPRSDAVGEWTGEDLGFDDDPATTDWFAVDTAIGYGDSAALAGITQTDLEASMRSVNSSALLRVPFELRDLPEADAMSLRVAYDDGFVGFLNGHRVAEANAPTELRLDGAATSRHEAVGDLFSLDPQRVAILYDFEDNGGQAVTDKLDADQAQHPVFNSGGSVDTRANRAAFGTRSLRLPSSLGPPSIFNRLQLPGTADLGQRFTLAVHADLASRDFQRLFSNYNGTGPVDSERLIFDVDPRGTQISGVRVSIGNRGALQTETVPARLSEPGYHHFAMTYDNGDIQVYVDAELVLVGTLGSGSLNMPLDLFFGEDPHDGGGTANEQLSGNFDDVLVLTDAALPPIDIGILAREGAEALFNSGGREPLFETFDLSDQLGRLRVGSNVLALQGLNISADDEDFFLLPELTLTRFPDGRQSSYFVEPTPGAINRMPLVGIVADTTVTMARGFYVTPFRVQVTSATPGAAIVYTTDGSEPALTNGIVVEAADDHAAPIVSVTIDTTTTLRSAAFKAGFQPSSIDTQTYIFLHDVIRQGDQPELPRRWGRTRADYAMDPDVVDVEPYRQTIVNDLKSIPTMSLALDRDDFFGPEGIYSNTVSRGRAWERPVSVEYFDASGDREFQIDAGVRVHGGFSRDPSASPQHSLRLHFRSDYGPGKLRFPLFDDSSVAEFDSLVLNAQSSDNWTSVNRITGQAAQFLRDQWAQDMQREMGQVHLPGTYVHLYINGLYWGLYNVMERLDDDFAAAHYGGTASEHDVIVDEVAFRGNLTAWNEMLTRVRAGDYERTLELLDVDNFIDYMILNIFMGNWDWPDHNWHAVRRRVEGETFKFLVWDAEVGLGLDVNVPGPIRSQVLDVDLAGRRRDVSPFDLANGPGEIYDRLRTIPEFQLRFADRLHKHLFNRGALTAERAAAVYGRRASQIERALVGEAARWGDVRRHPPDVPDGTWASERDWILNTFFPQRGAIVLEDFRDENLYPHVAAPSFSQHGGPISAEFALAISHANEFGNVLYTLDGTDPRSAGGAIAANALTYSVPLVLTTETTLKARVLTNGEWSALNEAHFLIVPLPGDFNADDHRDETDIALLCSAIGSADAAFDLSQDSRIDGDDLRFLIETVFATFFGDANLDGVFDSSDLVLIFQKAE